ncbi:MAG: hypothetical protein DWQ37_15760 [Planctomycetota bacterium]|nr:MAG: hypothetical protein DWQ37_15760 [Planctomycetota bacterium]
MPPRRPRVWTSAHARSVCWLWVCCALLLSGCANCRIPRIDPTGERLFIFGDPNPPSPYPGAPPQVIQPGLALNPSQVIAPVGSEVIMIATVIGEEGYPLTRERVEWMLAADSPGQITSPGERRPLAVLDWLHHLPRKVTNTYAINNTLTGATLLDRGTVSTADDITVGRGQAWVSVTSATEGTSHLTAFAPGVAAWDRRQQSAMIHWVDAQWRFPSPAITPVGGRSTLTTTVTRGSDGAPLPGWVVRYEIAGGPAAGFAPDGSATVEVLTGPTGDAPAEIFQQQPVPGTNLINIQVLRPMEPGQIGQPPIGSGTVLQTWASDAQPQAPYNPQPTVQPSPFVPVVPGTPVETPPLTPSPPVETTPEPSVPVTPTVPAGRPELEVSVIGPLMAEIGTDVQFEIKVANLGSAPATGILVTDRFDVGLEHVAGGGPIERNLSDLQPGQSGSLAVTFHVVQAGELCQDITVTAADDVRATTRRCLSVGEPALPQPIEPEPQPDEPTGPEEPADIPPGAAQVSVTKKGPERRSVGEMAVFQIEVTNTGDTPIRDLQIADNYEITLRPNRATPGSEWLPGNAMGWTIDLLEPGATVRREIELECLRETPRACNRVTVSAPGIQTVADEACLEIVVDSKPQAAPAAQGVTVSVAETADPINIGGRTTYQVIVTNPGAESVFDVKAKVKYSDLLQLQEFSPPPGSGAGTSLAGAVEFAAIRELRAGETLTYELRFRGAEAGKARVQAEVTTRDTATPVTDEQTTEVLP